MTDKPLHCAVSDDGKRGYIYAVYADRNGERHAISDYPLRLALSAACDYLARCGMSVPDDLQAAIKSQGFYDRKINELTKDLYRGSITQTAFEDALLAVMDQQLDKAWREGMKENGLDPAKDMTPEWEQELERLKLSEVDHIEGFADAIVDAAQADATAETPGASLPGLQARGGLWAERYTEVVNAAIIATAQSDDRLVWRLGATEEHCETCAELNGYVQTADWWDKSGIMPQAPENPVLACGGWLCDCRMEPTKEPISERTLSFL